MLPDPITKRDLIWARHKSPPDWGAHGDEFLKEGRFADAADFFAKAGDKARMQRLVDAALREGDAPTIARIASAMSDLVTAETWRRCATEAERLEKHSFARAAWEKAGDAAKAQAARERVWKTLGYTVAKASSDETGSAGAGQPAQA